MPKPRNRKPKTVSGRKVVSSPPKPRQATTKPKGSKPRNRAVLAPVGGNTQDERPTMLVTYRLWEQEYVMYQPLKSGKVKPVTVKNISEARGWGDTHGYRLVVRHANEL